MRSNPSDVRHALFSPRLVAQPLEEMVRGRPHKNSPNYDASLVVPHAAVEARHEVGFFGFSLPGKGKKKSSGGQLDFYTY